MLRLDFSEINFLAVLVAAVASFLLGGVWYAALFGTQWAKAHRYTEEQAKELGKTPAKTFSIIFVTQLIVALGVAVFAANLGADTALKGVALGAALWVGVAGPINLMDNAAHNKPIAAFVIDGSHQLIYLALTGAIIGAWR